MTKTQRRMTVVALLLAALHCVVRAGAQQLASPPEIAGAPTVSPGDGNGRPETYHGKVVRAHGVLKVASGQSTLILSKDTAVRLGVEVLWISVSASCRLIPLATQRQLQWRDVDLGYFDGRRVVVTGRFNKDLNGRRGEFVAAVEDVSEVRESRRWYESAIQYKDHP